MVHFFLMRQFSYRKVGPFFSVGPVRMVWVVALLVFSKAAAQTPEFNVEMEARNREFNLNTGEMVLLGDAVVRYGDGWILAADSINVNQQTGRALAEGNVVATRGDIRLTADRFEYQALEKFARIENFRVGNGRVYADGSLLEGNIDDFSFTDVSFFPGEPGTYLFKGRAKELALVDRNVVKGEKLSFKLGVVPFLIIPNISHPIDADTNLFKANIDYSGHIGGAIGGEFRVPVSSNARLGANIALTTKRGILAGPTSQYAWGDDDHFVNGWFTSGFIDDSADEVGVDVLGNNIGDKRFFTEWRHRQVAGDHLSVSAYTRYWSDSEVTRDFHEDSYNAMQDPDSYFEANYNGSNWQASLFMRASPNNFQIFTERMPELRFSLFPTRIAKGLYHGGTLSFAKLRQTRKFGVFGDLDFGDPSNLDSDRADAYYGLKFYKQLREGAQFSVQLGARATHYFDTAELLFRSPSEEFLPDVIVSENDRIGIRSSDGTRVHGEAGFDLKFTSYRVSEYQNKIWNIDGIRHVIEPIISYRYQPELENDIELAGIQDFMAFSSYLSPIDLEDRRDIDFIGEEHRTRFELRNRIQTRDKENGSRDLARFSLAIDHYLDDSLQVDDWSDLHLDFDITPAQWLEIGLFSRYDFTDGDLREFNSSIALTDTGYWKLGFGNHFVKGADLDQYFVFGDYYLNDNFKVYAAAKFDEVSDSFYEQRIGIMQRALEDYGLKYELRIYDGPRRETDFSIRISVDLFDE